MGQRRNSRANRSAGRDIHPRTPAHTATDPRCGNGPNAGLARGAREEEWSP